MPDIFSGVKKSETQEQEQVGKPEQVGFGTMNELKVIVNDNICTLIHNNSHHMTLKIIFSASSSIISNMMPTRIFYANLTIWTDHLSIIDNKPLDNSHLDKKKTFWNHNNNQRLMYKSIGHT